MSSVLRIIVLHEAIFLKLKVHVIPLTETCLPAHAWASPTLTCPIPRRHRPQPPAMAKTKKSAVKRYKMYDHSAEKSQATSRALAYHPQTRRVRVDKKVLKVNVTHPATVVDEGAYESIATQQITDADLGVVVVTKKPAKRYINSVSLCPPVYPPHAHRRALPGCPTIDLAQIPPSLSRRTPASEGARLRQPSCCML